MKIISPSLALFLSSLASGAAFTPCSKNAITSVSISASSLTLAAAKKGNDDTWSDPEPKKKPNLLRVLLTGAEDGVMLFGKPQHDWSTGKAVTKSTMHNWNSYKRKDPADTPTTAKKVVVGAKKAAPAKMSEDTGKKSWWQL